MKTKEKEMKEIRSHAKALMDIIGEDGPGLFNTAVLRAAAAQAAEVHRALERLIGRVDAEESMTAQQAMKIGGDNDPTKYVRAA